MNDHLFAAVAVAFAAGMLINEWLHRLDRRDLAAENRSLKRHIHESQATARAQHPSNVVPIRGLDERTEEWGQ